MRTPDDYVSSHNPQLHNFKSIRTLKDEPDTFNSNRELYLVSVLQLALFFTAAFIVIRVPGLGALVYTFVSMRSIGSTFINWCCDLGII